MTRTMHVTFRGREVTSQPARTAVVAFIAVYGALVAVLMLALSPLLAALHYGLRRAGRHGFTYASGDGTFSIHVSADGFRHV